MDVPGALTQVRQCFGQAPFEVGDQQIELLHIAHKRLEPFPPVREARSEQLRRKVARILDGDRELGDARREPRGWRRTRRRELLEDSKLVAEVPADQSRRACSSSFKLAHSSQCPPCRIERVAEVFVGGAGEVEQRHQRPACQTFLVHDRELGRSRRLAFRKLLKEAGKLCVVGAIRHRRDGARLVPQQGCPEVFADNKQEMLDASVRHDVGREPQCWSDARVIETGSAAYEQQGFGRRHHVLRERLQRRVGQMLVVAPAEDD